VRSIFFRLVVTVVAVVAVVFKMNECVHHIVPPTADLPEQSVQHARMCCIQGFGIPPAGDVQEIVRRNHRVARARLQVLVR
jgi:hypothetical protein